VEGDGDGVDEEQDGEVVRIGGVPGGIVWWRGVVERRRPPLDPDLDRERGDGRVGDGVDGVRGGGGWAGLCGRMGRPVGSAGPGGPFPFLLLFLFVISFVFSFFYLFSFLF